MSKIKIDIKRRYTYIYMLFLFVGIRIVIKIFQLMIFEHDKYANEAQNLNYAKIEVPAKRGDIFARDGRMLVSSIPFFEIRMDLDVPSISDEYFNNHVDSLATSLANLFNDTNAPDYKTKEQYLFALINERKKKNKYYLIKRKANYREYKAMKDFPIFNRGRIRGGFIAEQHLERKKLFKSLAARTIGRVKNKVEASNIVGIEGAYDKELQGVDGFAVVQKLHTGKILRTISDENTVEPVDGKDIITTIDIDIQDIVEHELLEGLKYHQADFGTAIVMEVKTGNVIAIANLTDTAGHYLEIYNYAIGFRAEPGSTFKLMSLISAFEDGYLDLSDMVNTQNGVRYFHGVYVRDWNGRGFGKITVKEAFEQSSNVGIAKLIYRHYKNSPEKYINRLYAMNLNKKVGIELYGEPNPYIKYPGDKLWSKASLVQIAYGYEIELTPLQILTFYNAIANNGVMVRPKFVDEIRYHGQLLEKVDTTVINPSICSIETLKKAKSMLEGVILRGTAKKVRCDNYKIAGKTGTAKIYDKKLNKYVYKYRTSFAGYFPADNPVYSIFVMIANPKAHGHGGSSVAAPVFRSIADKIYPKVIEFQDVINKKMLPVTHLAEIPETKSGYKTDIDSVLKEFNVPRQYKKLNGNWIHADKKSNCIEYSDAVIGDKVVPNVKGMGARDAITLLENLGLNVKINGRGVISKQSLPPGTKIESGKEIILYMNLI